MLETLARELHYQYRCLRLGWGFLTKRFIHCNLQVTYRCNFACQICDFWKTPPDPADELTLDEVRVIGEKLHRLGTLIISLAGGEPLIRRDLFDIIRILNDWHHFPILITNGWFVEETVAKEILRAGLQEISVSLDYADPARHDAQRGRPGSWERAVRALELLNRHRPDRRHRVHMITVLMDDNLDEIEPLIKLARDLGVTYMVNLYSWNRGTKTRRLPTAPVTARLLALKRRYPEFITLTTYLEHLDEAIAEGGIGQCQTGRLLLNIDPRGQVARCTETLDQPVGNILTDDIMDLRARLRRVQRRRPCSQCWTSCRGFAESMYRPPRWRQFVEFYHSVKPH
ncbi:MAG: Radical SAM domain heme biosynthesis protein [Candidatus Ozemobacter sibiricus]|uniref:Radical SAM domain heme biosynthesis protein n=1 Tax=Candidatus Ozemobacter sibiricus TaxID=2268124 RepID=A0A367ZTU8_9BACT|nr:MAG: Radical SAM domain heme biosynthesis protein [Candidatus Ozemobacter sibiricus]